MEIRIETEKKYFLDEPELLINKLNGLGFKLVKSGKETDEYFTDIDSNYIKDRICLRIRMTDNDMIITHKGKSSDFSSVYSKMESEFSIGNASHNDVVKLFKAIGYYLYTTVKKQRSTYTLKKSDCIYNVMIDTIEGVGGFVEFEILSNTDIENQDDIRLKLDEFVNLFNDLKLSEADLPYRDFVANAIYNDLLPKNGISRIYLKLDKSLNDKLDSTYHLIFELLKKLNKKNIKISSNNRNVIENLNIDYINIDENIDLNNEVLINCDDLDKTISQLLIIYNLVR